MFSFRQRVILASAAFFLGVIVHGRAEVKLSAIFGDHMVLQQQAKIPVWGWAAPGEEVTVTLGGRNLKTKTTAEGNWRVDFKPFEPNAQPVKLVVEGTNRLEFQDVLLGDIWVCSGQSNMGWPFSKSYYADTELPKANHPQLRLFEIRTKAALQPEKNLVGEWKVCTPEALTNFGTLPYFFGRDLNKHLNRPIGLVAPYWGGSCVQAWTSVSGLQQSPAFTTYVDQLQKAIADYPQAKEAFPKLLAEYETQRKEWEEQVDKPYNAAMLEWDTAQRKAHETGKPAPPKPNRARPAPTRPTPAEGGAATPSVLFNGMVSPLIPYAIKGVIWYQGESNTNPLEYGLLFQRMITDWRQKWAQGDFPFLFVQLPNIGGGPATHPTEDSPWAVVREGQRNTLALPRTGMVVAIDVGEAALHPRDKLDVAQRLELVARHVAYGEDIVYSGPLYNGMQVEKSAIRLNFTNTGGGLTLGVSPWNPTGAPVAMPTELKGFAISGADKKWFWAKAVIDGNTVVVSSDLVATPVAVRYGWAQYPPCNLYNKEGLPASPFATDEGK